MQAAFDAVVLAGGTSRRMSEGGTPHVDKTDLDVGGVSLVQRAVAAVAAARRVAVVGPPRDLPDRVVWCREEPAGAGPAAAVMAGFAATAALAAAPIVVVLAADVPFAASAVPRLVAALAAAVAAADAAMLVDGAQHRQPLVAAYTRATLGERAGESWENRAVRDLVAGMRVVEVAAQGAESLDCDTPADLQRAQVVATSEGAQRDYLR